MSVIKPINHSTVHQICSGQVILDLATAVKELLENAIDAGASAIEIRLKEYGMSSIEVSDNGYGIEESNYEGLTMKHHTSKLQEFSDLTSVETFGFRGEALSSLCALSDLVVTTRCKSCKVGHKLEYDHQGNISKKSCVARQVGTSVLLKNIFVPLPVRHVEFVKNIKREFSKLLNLMYSYCMVCTDVQISCSNEVKSVKREVFRTNNNNSTEDNIVSLFGSKIFKSLLQFKQNLPTIESCERYHLNHSDCLAFSKDCGISGYISSCEAGRKSADMQFISVNKRPCHLPKITKLVNEVFRLFSKSNFPFTQLDISIKRDDVDINVTPDKRQVFLTHEKAILAIIKSSLFELYNGRSHIIGTVSSKGLIQSSLKWNTEYPATDVNRSIRMANTRSASCGTDQKGNVSNSKPVQKIDNAPNHQINRSVTLQPKAICGIDCDSDVTTATSPPQPEDKSVIDLKAFGGIRFEKPLTTKFSPHQNTFPDSESNNSETKTNRLQSSSSCMSSSIKKFVARTELPIRNCGKLPLAELNGSNMQCRPDSSVAKVSNPIDLNSSCTETFDSAEDVWESRHKPCEELAFSFKNFERNWNLKDKLRCREYEDSEIGGLFKAKIKTSENSRAEKELSKHFERDDFRNMRVIGQFNLGFILVRFGNDLFIIDQHASDEKYNFEDLLKHTKLKGQALIAPQKLELTASDVMVLEENMETFIQNGFSFDIRETECGPKSVFLLKVPSSKNTVLDASDVSELIFLLRDSPNVLCRPSRIRSMFASRACRKSIMVGTALTMETMTRVVSHMSEMDQPWNCPHGRPTMRHLIDMSMVLKPA